MFENIKKHAKKSGHHPGFIVHIGEKKVSKTKISSLFYNSKELKEYDIKNVEELFAEKNAGGITWINVEGLHDISLIEKIGAHFDIHALILEDITNTGQRPKIEEFDDYIFIVMNMLYYNKSKKEIDSDQVSLVLGKDYLISFQEAGSQIIDSVKNHIFNSKGKIRKSGSDYLAYSIMDAIVDNYFGVLEKIGEQVEEIEENLIRAPDPRNLEKLYGLKREMLYLRKSVWPLREVISSLQRTESKLFSKATNVYLRDIYDHTIEIMDTIEIFRDVLSGMVDIYLSSLSNKTNEIMKMLTIIATIFIPLTFITGVYGMNFDYMPELSSQYGYIATWVVMISIAAIMVLYFRKKDWL